MVVGGWVSGKRRVESDMVGWGVGPWLHQPLQLPRFRSLGGSHGCKMTRCTLEVVVVVGVREGRGSIFEHCHSEA